MRSISGETSVRRAAVAGLFYPSDPGELRADVSEHLRQAERARLARRPKALIVPHAGYVYSGDIAAQGYAQIAPQREQIRRVVLIGPSHRVYLRGAAVPRSDEFETPLGRIPIDREMRLALLERGDVLLSDQPHFMEHSLEVQLPFLQVVLGEFTLLPIVVGDADAAYVSAVLQDSWGADDTLVLASSDLSHYHAYEVAERLDSATADAILRFATDLSGDQACGAVALNGVLHAAAKRRLDIKQIARCNSGDTAGDRERVVGYGAFALYEGVA